MAKKGIFLRKNAKLGLIDSNFISENKAEISGAGLFNCDGQIVNNDIMNNIVSGTGQNGGGLAGCDDTISSNVISGNTCHENGGGLYSCNGIIEKNIISDNSAGIGGGGLDSCSANIRNNIINNNSAGLSGGGLKECEGTIANNTILGNSVYDTGGGLSLCSGNIINCIIWNNSAPTDPQIHYSEVLPSYSCIQDWPGEGISNISDSPNLADPDSGNFHLQENSPCIDAGGHIENLIDDFEDDPRPFDYPGLSGGDGSNFDIGADEVWYPEPGPNDPPSTPTLNHALSFVISVPSVDPESKAVTYNIKWESNDGHVIEHSEVMVAHGELCDVLTNCDKIKPGQEWTVTVTPSDDQQDGGVAIIKIVTANKGGSTDTNNDGITDVADITTVINKIQKY